MFEHRTFLKSPIAADELAAALLVHPAVRGRYPIDDGFSLLEVMMVVALIGTITAIAVPVSTAMIARARGDSTAIEVQTWLQETRNRSIAERRNFEVTFDAIQHRIRIERLEPDASKTPVLQRDLPDGARFLLFDGAPDTPDRFGMGSAVDLDGPGPHLFTSDGSFIDGNGDPSNGTIFIGRPNQQETGRAVTILGITGLISAWKLSGNVWYR